MDKQSWVFRSVRQSFGKSVLGFFGLVFFAAFPLGALFLGWTTVSVRCDRESIGASPNCSIDEEHWLGLYVNHRIAEGVTDIESVSGSINSRSLTGAGYNRNVSVDGIVFVTKNGETPLFSGKSNLNDEEKDRAKSRIGAYLSDPDRRVFDERMDFRNIFGVIGWAGLVLFGWMLLKMIFGVVFPQRVDLDRLSGVVSVRPKTGTIRLRRFSMQDIAEISIVSGDAAFALAFPKLAKIGASSKRVTVADSLVFRLASGEEVGVPNFANAPREELEAIVEAVRAVREWR